MKGERLALKREWLVGDQIGAGGFGRVFLVTSGSDEAVAKFVPKVLGAARELLFVNAAEVPNVVPILETGEIEDYWVLVMPRAECSLRDHLQVVGGLLGLEEATQVLKDVADALVGLEGRIVHRDLKPENVLRLGTAWCLADFGISRYAEATTAPDTQKFALSPFYAAPERWRSERATAATDVYAVGVMAVEMLSGARPFEAGTPEELRDLHLHAEPPHLQEAPAALSALIEECLFKAPEARPSPANLRARLDRVSSGQSSGGMAELAEANLVAVRQRQEESRRESEARTESERRRMLAEAGTKSHARIATELREAIEGAAPSSITSASRNGGWSVRLGEAELTMSSPSSHEAGAWGGWALPLFDVVLAARVVVRTPPDRHGYEGRGHSLWYCDAQEEGRFAWYETAFMISALVPRQGRLDPFAFNPGEESAKALWVGMAEYQVAWPFTELAIDDLDDFIDRWADWFAAAARGALSHPSTMPERSVEGTWRRDWRN